MDRKTKRIRSARVRRAGGKKEQGWPSAGATVVIIVLMVTLTFRAIDTGPIGAFKAWLGAVILGEIDYKEAMATIGRAVDFEDFTGKAQEAVRVFGSRLFNSDAEEDTDASGDAADEEAPAEEDGAVIEEYPPVEPNVFPEYGEDEAEQGHTALHEMIGGAQELSLVEEAVMPESLDAVLLRSIEQTREYEDDTTSGAFEIPSPDIVDDTVYDLPFSYKSPLKGRITSPFGYRDHPIDGLTKFHYGADIAVPTGTAVGAFAAGTVSEIGKNTIYGNYVKVQHADGFWTFYGHLSRATVKKGAKVKMGQKIALSGNTGNSTGPHLHFEVRHNNSILNPFDYVAFR